MVTFTKTIASILVIIFCNISPVHARVSTDADAENVIVKFAASNFTLPVEMAYTTEIGVLKKAPSISWSEEGAKNFMIDLTKKAIAVILQEMIPSHLVESILKLITVKFQYEPLKCTTVHVGKSRGPSNHCDSSDEGVCFIYENTVIGVCDNTSANVTKTVKQVPKKYLTLNGSLKMSYYFLGPWNEKQWRAFFDEVQRYLSRSRFGDYFSGMSLIITSIETE